MLTAETVAYNPNLFVDVLLRKQVKLLGYGRRK
jgi:hypothetical protein